MSFVLFGHSFVKRLKRKRGSQFKIELQSKVVPVTCIGEGGLTLSRIRARPRKYYEYLRQANPLVLIIDLGTNDLCSKNVNPNQVHSSLCDFVYELPKRGINPEVIVFLPVLPRTGGLRGGQVSLEEFNDRAERFNDLIQQSTFVEDQWWLWEHRGLKNSRYNLDGVHLNTSGMALYGKTLRQITKYFESRIWA